MRLDQLLEELHGVAERADPRDVEVVLALLDVDAELYDAGISAVTTHGLTVRIGAER